MVSITYALNIHTDSDELTLNHTLTISYWWFYRFPCHNHFCNLVYVVTYVFDLKTLIIPNTDSSTKQALYFFFDYWICPVIQAFIHFCMGLLWAYVILVWLTRKKNTKQIFKNVYGLAEKDNMGTNYYSTVMSAIIKSIKGT